MKAINVLIHGAGAMGCFYGGMLSKRGHNVTLIGRQYLVDAIKENDGLTMRYEDHDEIVPIRAFTNVKKHADEIGNVDVVFVFVKTYHTAASVADCAPVVTETTIMVTLQNGLGNKEQLEPLVTPDRMLYGVTISHSTMAAPGVVSGFSGNENNMYTSSRTITDYVKYLTDEMTAAGLPVVLSPDIDRRVFIKLCVNAVFNPISSIFRLRVGGVADECKWLVERVCGEVAALAHAEGIKLTKVELTTFVYATGQKAYPHRPSMFQDVLKRKPTEIDAISGQVVARSRQHGLEAPTCEMLHLMTKTLEKTYDLYDK